MADLQSVLLHYSEIASQQFQKVPGSAIVLRYIRSSYQNDPIRSAIELFLFLFAVGYLLSPSYETKDKNKIVLTEDEIDDLVEEWQPEPIVEPETPEEIVENEKRPTIIGATGPKCRVATANGSSKLVTNLASYNFYNFVGNETLKEKAIQTLRKYGVGPCGPPGFYGTQDVHMEAEKAVAAHLGVPNCIIYAQAFSTISSVIPAFSKRGDIIVADKAVNYSIRKGLQVSRSKVYWYEHNDMADLERLLRKIVKENARKPLTRRFIVSEGLFENVGDVVDLPRLVELKHRYKFRIILDETWSYGVLGEGGRGVTEAQNVDANQVDMLIGSLAGPICSGGGFCAGSPEVVEHQRIMATAYTYSAALPAMLATTAVETIQLLKDSPEYGIKLQENIDTMWAQFDPKNFPKQQWVTCTSSKQNPIMIFVLKDDLISRYEISVKDQEAIIQEVVDEALRKDVLVTKVRHMPLAIGVSSREQPWQPQPALKVCMTSGLTKKEVESAGQTIRRSLHTVMEKRKFKR
ncbi:uncharacterized protein PV09_08105 [Verruconis gallopava]|uniref:serine C-palmitoyltransferase n=1 Tax=Verruconis gallopava TaxID=253628 RepID=A0A0D1XDX0_9PEZI|nr:uncharacterized protein PV09_08105 [Verruconis gallopava]KIW00396.1 hypothetical protein PV09_08105 [Verruconis gallopava]